MQDKQSRLLADIRDFLAEGGCQGKWQSQPDKISDENILEAIQGHSLHLAEKMEVDLETIAELGKELESKLSVKAS